MTMGARYGHVTRRRRGGIGTARTMRSVLIADEIDVVVVGPMSDLRALNDQPGYPHAQLVE